MHEDVYQAGHVGLCSIVAVAPQNSARFWLGVLHVVDFIPRRC